MSEFSDSLHFYTISHDELKKKLQELEVSAFIMNSNEHPFSVLADWEDKETISNNDFGCYLDYSYGEDHGIFCKFYKDGQLIGRLNKSWGDNFGIEEPEDSPNAEGIELAYNTILEDIEVLSETDLDKFKALCNKYNLNDYEQRETFISEIGEILKLKHYRNLNNEDMQYNLEMLLELNPEGNINL